MCEMTWYTEFKRDVLIIAFIWALDHLCEWNMLNMHLIYSFSWN
jgi:hypothetical protein